MALELLQRWGRGRAPADELLDEALVRSGLSSTDRALVTELFYGCLRRRLALGYLLGRVAGKPPRPVVANILKLGLYQLLFLDKIPVHAAVHETVELAKARQRGISPAEAGFVNAVLRRVAQNRAAYATELGATRESEPWVYFSHPQWLWTRWAARWGAADTAALCEWNNTPPPIYIRVNRLKVDGQAPAEPRPPDDIPVEPCAFHPLCWRVTDPSGLFDTEPWKRGGYYAQDPSTLVAVDLLDPQPGEAVLDMCAAPGGKTTYIAQKMQNRGKIVAADSSGERLQRLIENCRRLGVTIVATLPCEGTRLDRCLRGATYDRVLVDVPCSNTGVLRRRVDLRWRLQEKELARLAALQQRLLKTAASLTRPGGVLVYSTCSLEPEENERVVEPFCRSNPQFALETTRSLFPPRDGVDGAFIARFAKH